jgi:hypothetical protein
MKRLLIVILVGMAMTCCSCEQCKKTEIKPVLSEPIEAEFGESSYFPFKNTQRFNYEGHTYIAFWGTNGYKGWGGIVHDPDCECHKIKDLSGFINN